MGKAKARVTGPDHPLHKSPVAMSCEVCGTVRMVKPSLVARFRACSRRCAAILGHESMPRSSSLETAVAAVLVGMGERFDRQVRIGYYVVDFHLPDRNLVIECDGDYWHSLPNQRRIDRAKDGYMATHGIGIAHLSEREIKADAVGTVARVLHD